MKIDSTDIVGKMLEERDVMTTNRKGFSIVELIVVCAIVVVLSVIATPAFLRYQGNANLRSATRELTSDISRQKANAITENLKKRITFSEANETYTVQEDNGGGGYTSLRTTDLKSFGSNINITGSYTMTFQTRGTANNGTITITNKRGSTATITVNITGRTYVDFNMQ